jgi:hypothetical protein
VRRRSRGRSARTAEILDGLSFAAAMRETHRQARAQGRSIAEQLRDTTEPARPTELIGNGIAFVGAAVAIVALALAQATGSTWPDTIASLLIGLALMVAAVALTQLNRSLLTGRGIRPELLEQMRRVIAAPGVIDVPICSLSSSDLHPRRRRGRDIQGSAHGARCRSGSRSGRHRPADSVARGSLRVPDAGRGAPPARC